MNLSTKTNSQKDYDMNASANQATGSTDIVELLMNDYLRVPTIILQMQPVLKNASAYVCLQFIWAKTGGWKNDKDTISYSQFKNDKRYGTGLSTKTIQRSVEKLTETGVIIVKHSFNNMYEYSINIEKIKQLVGGEAKTICPSLDDTSQDNLSTSLDNLSSKSGQFVCKSGQNDLHTITSTLDSLHNTFTQDEKSKKSNTENPAPEKPKPTKPAKPKPTKKRVHDFVEFEFTDNQKSKCDKYGINITELLEAFRDYHESKGNQFVDWSKAFNTWINNKIKFENLKPIAERSNHGINRATDKLAVNNQWRGNESNIVAPNTSIEDMLGGA